MGCKLKKGQKLRSVSITVKFLFPTTNYISWYFLE